MWCPDILKALNSNILTKIEDERFIATILKHFQFKICGIIYLVEKSVISWWGGTRISESEMMSSVWNISMRLSESSDDATKNHSPLNTDWLLNLTWSPWSSECLQLKNLSYTRTSQQSSSCFQKNYFTSFSSNWS